MRRLLHVGSGWKQEQQVPPSFLEESWEEVRLDINPGEEPDIVSSIIAMPQVSDASFDALYTSHTIEHLYSHEVPLAFAEFRRVLGPQGFAVLTCPDIQEVAREIAQGRLAEAVTFSPAGPIAPLDLLFGWRPALAAGNHFMAHRCGFTKSWLSEQLLQAGFAKVLIRKPHGRFNLWTLATVSSMPAAELQVKADRYLFRAPRLISRPDS